MIRLIKNPKPQILEEKAEQWTRTLIEKLARGEILKDSEKNKYRNPRIKEALVDETKGKCAYCESKLLHIHHGDVEHIYPKSRAPEKSFEWDNLTLACEICNQNKSNKDPLVEAIIDPYKVDPTAHLMFAGALVFPLGTPHGISTVEILDLNRGELAEMRKQQLEKIMGIYNLILRGDVPVATKRAIYQNLLAKEGSKDAPYTAMALEVIRRMKINIPDEVT